MVSACCAYGCSNRSSQPRCKEERISFHQFPLNEPYRLNMWLVKIRRKSFKPTKHSKICSEHFEENDFEYELFTNRRKLKRTAVPKFFCFSNETKPQSRSNSSSEYRSGTVETENLDQAQASPNEVSTQTDENLYQLLLQELQTVKEENTILKNRLKVTEISPDSLDDHSMNIVTGFSHEQFNAIHSFLSSIEKQKLFFFFLRLKTGMTESMMGIFLKKNQSSISRMFTTATNEIYNKIATVNIWPDKEKLLESMPCILKENLPRCRVIIDCNEFIIQKPSDPTEQKLTFSNYMVANTVKCLIGISPAGSITFISEAWGGSISDKDLFLKSGILDILEPGDLVFADPDFAIKEEVEAKGCKLITPEFTKDKIMFSIIKSQENKKILRHRIHIDRAAYRIKQFKFFNSQIPYNSREFIRKLIYIAAFFINFGKSLIKC